MNADKLFTLLGSIVLLAIITTLILPGRQTASVISSFFGGFGDSIRSAMASSTH